MKVTILIILFMFCLAAMGLKVYLPSNFTGQSISNISVNVTSTGIFEYVREATGTEPVPYWQMTNYVSGLGSSSITTNEVLNISDNGVDIVKVGFFQGYLTVLQEVSNTIDHLKFGAETRKDDDFFSHSISVNPDEILVKKSGWYKISYEVCWFQNSGDNDRHVMHTWVDLNGSKILPSSSYSYTRDDNYGQYDSCKATFVKEVSAGGKIMLSARRISGSYSPQALSNQTWILIEKI